MQAKNRVIVVGGGAAGMLAAIAAAGGGAETLLLEKTDRLGFKIRISGGGRCNLTNQLTEPRELAAMYPGNGRFLMDALRRFGARELLELLERHGVRTKVEPPYGKVFPVSDRSTDVVRALEAELEARGVRVHRRTPVAHLVTDSQGLVGVRAEDGSLWPAAAAIVAVGGQSLSRSGSTGDGYRLAREVGHTVTPLFPSLVPLRVLGTRELAGVALRDVEGSIWVDGKLADRRWRGDVLFTHTGLSGPIVLQLSRAACSGLSHEQPVELRLNLVPDLAAAELDAELVRRGQAGPHARAASLLRDWLPRSAAAALLTAAGIDAEQKAAELSRGDRQRLVETLRGWRHPVVGYHSFEAAEVTAGGVELRELDPRTMASRLVPGLYWAGEVLDIDGYVGGFNFQAAWSTGWLAGTSAAAWLAAQAESPRTQ